MNQCSFIFQIFRLLKKLLNLKLINDILLISYKIKDFQELILISFD